VDDEAVQVVAGLLRDRNMIDAEIAAVIGRPMTAGHLGEWIAARCICSTRDSYSTICAAVA